MRPVYTLSLRNSPTLAHSITSDIIYTVSCKNRPCILAFETRHAKNIDALFVKRFTTCLNDQDYTFIDDSASYLFYQPPRQLTTPPVIRSWLNLRDLKQYAKFHDFDIVLMRMLDAKPPLWSVRTSYIPLQPDYISQADRLDGMLLL